MFFTAPAILILIGTLFAASGAFWTSHKQNQFENELNQNQIEIKTKNNEIIKLNQKIAELSLHTMNLVTGGNSYAYISFSDNQCDTTEKVQLGNIFLTHEGGYPLYDLTIQISDVDNHKLVKLFTIGNIGSTQHIKHWPLNHTINFDLSEKKSQKIQLQW